MSKFGLFYNLMAVFLVLVVFWLAAGKFFDQGFEGGVEQGYRLGKMSCG